MCRVHLALLVALAALPPAAAISRGRSEAEAIPAARVLLSQAPVRRPAAALVEDVADEEDANEDQEDGAVRELTMADLISGRARRNGTRGFLGGVPRSWAHYHPRDQEISAEVPAYETEAWETLLGARKLGPRPAAAAGPVWRGPLQALMGVLDSATPVDWYFLGSVLLVILAWDYAILQQLPETSRIHVVLLIFWLMVAVVFCVEIWLRLGPRAGVAWVTGYGLELTYSLEAVFVVQLLFSTFEVPRRLTTKALFLALLCAVATRFMFLMGLAELVSRLRAAPYAVGLALVYSGAQQLSQREDERGDVTQSAIVRAFRALLGERLGEFYDEEGEAVFAGDHKGRGCLTLLGVVVASLALADFLMAYDVVLVKAAELPSAYLNFSSSTLALFAVRAAFFALRDLFARPGVSRYGLGLALLFMGSEQLLGRAVYVNALASCTVLAALVAMAATVAWLRGPGPKAQQ